LFNRKKIHRKPPVGLKQLQGTGYGSPFFRNGHLSDLTGIQIGTTDPQILSWTLAFLKKQRRKRNISGQTLKDLSSLAESLPIFSDKKSVTQIHESAKVNCKSRQKLVAKETKQLAAVLAHPEFVSNPFSAVQQHLENTLGPQINTESKPKHGNKQKSSKGSKKKKGSKASPSSTVHAMEL
jgi:hypothetical protein